MKTNPSAVAIYARYSPDRQDARSIDDQMRRCRVLAAARGYSVVAEYGDAAVSGTHTDRANLQRLIADARRGGFRSLLVDDLSRLSRDLGDFWRLTFSEFASMGVRVVDVLPSRAPSGQGSPARFTLSYYQGLMAASSAYDRTVTRRIMKLVCAVRKYV
jgi:DNA invertase Pin-like site-specific DNA recombinase